MNGNKKPFGQQHVTTNRCTLGRCVAKAENKNAKIEKPFAHQMYNLIGIGKSATSRTIEITLTISMNSANTHSHTHKCRVECVCVCTRLHAHPCTMHKYVLRTIVLERFAYALAGLLKQHNNKKSHFAGEIVYLMLTAAAMHRQQQHTSNGKL